MSWPFLVLLSSVSIISTFSATSKTKDQIYILFHSRSAVLHWLFFRSPSNSSRSTPKTLAKTQNMSLHILHIHFQNRVLMTCFTHLKPTFFCVAQKLEHNPLTHWDGHSLIDESIKVRVFFIHAGIWATPIECHSWTFFFCWVHNLCRMTKVTCCVLSYAVDARKSVFFFSP